MDRASGGLRFEGAPGLPPVQGSPYGPPDRAGGIALVQQGDRLMEQSEPDQALAVYSRATAAADRDVAAAAVYGMGNALYRLDRDDEALQAWERVTAMGEAPVTYLAWRQVAAARVKARDLEGALEAYRQCERRAPPQDRPEIQSRLGWLSKETGNSRAAGRYFARSRGDTLPPIATYLTIAVTVIVSLLAMQNATYIRGESIGGPLESQLQLDKIAVAHGELYRLLSVVLVHDPSSSIPFHLLFNMYALWFVGPLVEKMYGARLFLFFYVMAGISASIASYVFGPSVDTVGASGAIFGLFGVILVATRYHMAILDSQGRAIAAQMGFLIVLNLAIGFSGVLGNVDNMAHIGGLLAGIWLALLVPPNGVPTLLSFWQNQRGEPSRLSRLGPLVLGVIALVGVLAAGYSVGTSQWQDRLEPIESTGHVIVMAAPATPPATYELLLS